MDNVLVWIGLAAAVFMVPFMVIAFRRRRRTDGREFSITVGVWLILDALIVLGLYPDLKLSGPTIISVLGIFLGVTFIVTGFASRSRSQAS
jgi:hypothetical protein